MRQKDNKHEFALYVADGLHIPFSSALDSTCIFTDQDLLHRITSVLRLSVGSKCVLFNAKHVVRVLIVAQDKRALQLLVVEKKVIVPLLPVVHWFLPVLDRDALEKAIYSLTVLGAASIQLVITQKTRRNAITINERARLERIMVAACEQAKQFVLPVLYDAVPLEIAQANVLEISHKLFFDAAGIPCNMMVTELPKEKKYEFICLIGPEGDMTSQEKESLKDAGFVFCALTPTILRAEDAVLVSMGILRAFL